MRRALFILASVLAFLTVSAQTVKILGIKASGGDTCTPATGDLINETFDPTGYDLGWTEQTAPGGGGVVLDEDNVNGPALAAAPSGTCIATQMLFSYGGTSTSRPAQAYINTGGTEPIFARVYFYFEAETMASGEARNVLGFATTAATGSNVTLSAKVMLVDTDGSGTMQFQLWKSTTGSLDSVSASLSTWYRIELTMNNTANTIDWKVCLANASTCDSLGESATDPAFTASRVFVGQDARVTTGYEGYFDNAAVCDGTWCGE